MLGNLTSFQVVKNNPLKKLCITLNMLVNQSTSYPTTVAMNFEFFFVCSDREYSFMSARYKTNARLVHITMTFVPSRP